MTDEQRRAALARIRADRLRRSPEGSEADRRIAAARNEAFEFTDEDWRECSAWLGLDSRPPAPEPEGCRHAAVTPTVPADDVLSSMSVEDIRAKHPRFEGVCPDCGGRVIAYGSFMHYIAGDW